MTLSPAVVAALACPVCDGDLTDLSAAASAAPRGPLGCADGHRFDVARQGHVTLTTRPIRHPGDTPAMLDARQVVQDVGVQQVVTDALVAAARAAIDRHRAHLGGAGTSLVVADVGAGTGHHLAAVLDGLAGAVSGGRADPAGHDAHGVALDSSGHAARRAARRHPRIGAVVADATDRIPLRDGAAALVLSVFAPRHGREMARVLAPGGSLLVVTPQAAHMQEVVGPLGLLQVDPDKQDRVDASLAPALRRVATTPAAATVTVDHPTLVAMLAMGPNAFHHETAALQRMAADLGAPLAVTIAVDVATFTHADAGHADADHADAGRPDADHADADQPGDTRQG